MKCTLAFLFFVVIAITQAVSAHPGGHGAIASNEVRTWTNQRTRETVTGAYLLTRAGNVLIEGEGET